MSGGRRAQASFGVLGVTYQGWRSYRAATGQDRHSRYVDPELRRPAAGDLHLTPGSPAMDAGLTEPPGDVGRRDIDGQPRVRGPRIDIGADELR